MTPIERLNEIRKELEDFGLDNGDGGVVDVDKEIGISVEGSRPSSVGVSFEVDLDEISEFTDLRDEAEELVSKANDLGVKLAEIIEEMADNKYSPPEGYVLVLKDALNTVKDAFERAFGHA